MHTELVNGCITIQAPTIPGSKTPTFPLDSSPQENTAIKQSN